MQEIRYERRSYPRFEVIVSAKHRVINLEEIFHLTRTRNISAEGICFESDEELKIGIYVEIELDLSDKMPPVRLVGEIKWSSDIKPQGPDKKKKYINGIKLVNIPASDEARFIKYYCDRMVEKLSAYLKM